MGSRVRVPSRPLKNLLKLRRFFYFYIMNKNRFISLIILLFFCKVLTAQNFISQTIEYDGNTREYELYIPMNYSQDVLSPLMFNFHGGNGNSEGQIAISDMRNLADENNFILVYPQAIADPTDDGSLNWIFKGDSDHDDIYFVDALISELSNQYQIDLERIYACGYSLGGEFVYELLCRLNNKIASGVAVARTMGQYQYENCNPEHPTAIMTILGTEDYESNYNGVVYNGVTYYISADDTHQYWANFNNTENDPIEIELPDYSNIDGSSVTKRVWENGDSCVSVIELRVNGGEHDWPGSFGNMDINSDNEIWDFVSKYSINGLIEDCSLSLTNNEGYSDFSYYPNPIDSYLNINNQSKNESVIIFDINSKSVFDSELIIGNNILDISDLQSGIYSVKIGLKTFKILKK
ncbi:MAG: hypothetical protein CMC36_00030 [Flavobacteriaceae bacterium]|nr:hypothetical protein [Flavobacteriaceae bacterium]